MKNWMKRRRTWRWYFRRDINGRVVEADKYMAISFIICCMVMIAVVGFA